MTRSYGTIVKLCLLVPVILAFTVIPPSGRALGEEDAGKKKKVKWVKSKTGLKSLMRLAKDRGDMVQEYKEETESHRKLSTAIDRGRLEKGTPASKVARKFGEPVIIIPGKEEGMTRWVYKPGTGTFLDRGPKIYLVFDDKDDLAGWERVEGVPKEEE